MTFRTLRTSTCVLSLALLPMSILSAAEVSLTPPVPEDITGLDAPGFGTEGLHVVRFTVRDDGKTDDVEVLGGFTNSMAEPFIKQAVQAWTFRPGKKGGAPETFYNQQYIMRNYLFDQPPVSEAVADALERASHLLAEEKHSNALKLLERLRKRQLVTAMEYVIVHDVLASVHMSLEQPYEALAASRLATLQRINSLGDTEFILPLDMLELALRKRFLLEDNLYQTAEALRTAALIEAAFELSDDDPLHDRVRDLQQRLASPEPIVLLAQLDEPHWSYRPVRPIFTLSDIEGRIRHIHVRCELGNTRLDYQSGVDWTLPQGLGQCALEFTGKKGTRFALHEFVE